MGCKRIRANVYDVPTAPPSAAFEPEASESKHGKEGAQPLHAQHGPSFDTSLNHITASPVTQLTLVSNGLPLPDDGIIDARSANDHDFSLADTHSVIPRTYSDLDQLSTHHDSARSRAMVNLHHPDLVRDSASRRHSGSAADCSALFTPSFGVNGHGFAEPPHVSFRTMVQAGGSRHEERTISSAAGAFAPSFTQSTPRTTGGSHLQGSGGPTTPALDGIVEVPTEEQAVSASSRPGPLVHRASISGPVLSLRYSTNAQSASAQTLDSAPNDGFRGSAETSATTTLPFASTSGPPLADHQAAWTASSGCPRPHTADGLYGPTFTGPSLFNAEFYPASPHFKSLHAAPMPALIFSHGTVGHPLPASQPGQYYESDRHADYTSCESSYGHEVHSADHKQDISGGTREQYGLLSSQQEEDVGDGERKKRPRRKHSEIDRMYHCGYEGCDKGYGTLNHLNIHVVLQKHGAKRTPQESREMRMAWQARRKEEQRRQLTFEREVGAGAGAESQSDPAATTWKLSGRGSSSASVPPGGAMAFGPASGNCFQPSPDSPSQPRSPFFLAGQSIEHLIRNYGQGPDTGLMTTVGRTAAMGAHHRGREGAERGPSHWTASFWPSANVKPDRGVDEFESK